MYDRRYEWMDIECIDPSQSAGRKWSRLVVVPGCSENKEKVVAERDTVLTETVQRKTVPVLDPNTGDLTVQTTETIERIIEREVTNPKGAISAAHIGLGEGRLGQATGQGRAGQGKAGRSGE